MPQKVPKAAAFVTVSQGIADEYKKRFGFDSTLVVSATPYRELPVGVVGSPPRLVHMITLGSASEFAVLASALEARASVVAAGSMFVLNRKHRTVLTDSEKALSLD